MRQYTSDNLVIHPGHNPADEDVIVDVTPALAGWDYIYFQVRRLRAGGQWSFETARTNWPWWF
jgi:5-deoxy-D-glucuronate isomerase